MIKQERFEHYVKKLFYVSVFRFERIYRRHIDLYSKAVCFRDIEIESKLPKQIMIKVRDEGLALMQYNKRNTVPLALDMDRVYFGKGEFVITADQLKNRLSRYVLPSTAVLSINPDTISVKYHRLSNKTLPIKVKSNISFASQYILSNDILVKPTLCLLIIKT